MRSPGPATSQAEPCLSDWVVSACPDGLWVLDDAGRTTFANERMAEMLGVAPADMVGFSAYDAFHAAGQVQFAEHLDRLRHAREEAEDLHCCLHSADGTQLWAVVRHAPLLDPSGGFRGWLHRVSEDTAQGRRYEELERREHQLAEAQEIARIGSWDWDLVQDRLTWSDQLFRVYGVDQETFEPSYEKFLDRLHPDDRDRVVSFVAEAVVDAEPFAFDFRFLGDDGEARWILGRGRPWCDAAGQVMRLSGTSQDITEAKETESALAFLSVMAGAANEAHTLQDVLVAADALVRPYTQWPAVLVSLPAEEGSSGLTHLDVDWEPTSDEQRRAARALATRVAEERRTIEVPGPGGNVLIGGAVVARGRLACVLVSDTRRSSDPSPADRNVFSQILTLLAHVAEREWTARQLADARDEALSASRAKSDFLATMSHEIRTPLNGVIGLSDLLGSTELTPHQRRLAVGVDEAGRTLLALVNDILDLSKIEAGRLELEEVDFDPRAVIEQSAGLVAERAREKHLELVVSSAADMPDQVRGDPVRFGQVITNLAANAVKFTSAGEVVIRATGGHGPDGDQVRVEVSDTGVGIAPEVEGRLFEAFAQADSSTTRQYGGTGLGLAISKRIVDAMDGEIGLQSEPGVGSTFWFTVTLAPPLQDGPGRDAARENAVAGLRVLVVDDNETNRWILTEKLTAWRVAVAAVDSTGAALAELDAAARGGASYDVVLLDYLMPGADGEQLARTVRADARHDRTRLVLLSSALEPSAEFLAGAGIDSFLSKPVLPARLLETLARLGGRLGEHRERPAPVRPTVRAGTRGRVLVVEDNQVNQLVAEGVLQRLGYDVRLTADGAEGVAAYAEDRHGFDAILMDCQMPVMDGYDATRAIRAMESTGARIPIIAMTAAVVAEERDRCLTAGMDDFLAKPVDVTVLEATLDQWVPRTGSRSAPSAVDDSSVTAGPREDREDEPAVLDRSRIVELLDGGAADPPLVVKMADRFGSRAVSAALEMGAAVRAGDATELRRVAHGLRGSALNLGLVRLGRLCEGIELGAGAGELPAERALDEVEEQVMAAIMQLDEFVDTLTCDATRAGG